MKKILMGIGIILLLGVGFLTVKVVGGVKALEKRQAQMVKSDEELIGRHFYMPRDGAEDVDMNLYLLEGEQPRPLVVNLHGGAFIAGDADTLDTQSDRISRAWNVNVATINYKRLQVGYDIPYGTKEIADAVKYFIARAEEYRIDPNKVFLLGYSAGGFHAIAAALALKRDGIDVAGQIVCYGFVGELDKEYRSLDQEARETFAPALFILADHDPISDGSLVYRQALADNGVKTEMKKFDGAIHGFIEENNPEYDALQTGSKSPEQEKLAREAENLIGAWIGENGGKQ